MPRFFCNQRQGEHILLTGEDQKHIEKSLRMKVGNPLVICDGNGMDYHGIIENMESQGVLVRILKQEPSQGEGTLEIHLYMGLPKGDKMDYVVQKSTEVGVTSITPLVTQFCVSRPKDTGLAKKISRWQKIAQEAAKQSGRGKIPEIRDALSFSDCVTQQQEKKILCYEQGRGLLQELPFLHTATSFGLIIGSEGGFSPEEVALAKENQVEIITLGRRILRCETAPIVGITWLQVLRNQL